MKQMRTQPYFKYAIDRLPADSRVEEAVAEYLGMRLSKNPNLQPKIWEACIDELVAGMRLTVSLKNKTKLRKIGEKKDELKIPDLLYRLQVATSRGYNHIYFTYEQDADWNNISYYQDPYWTKLKKEKHKILEEILNGSES